MKKKKKKTEWARGLDRRDIDFVRKRESSRVSFEEYTLNRMTRRGKRNYRSAREFDNGVVESTGGTTGRRISKSEGMKIVDVDNGKGRNSGVGSSHWRSTMVMIRSGLQSAGVPRTIG